MNFSSRLNLAIQIAAKFHNDYYRKGEEKIPYISHPFSVMYIASQFTNDEDILIACLLHDVLEDVKVLMSEKENFIKNTFGEKVLQIIKEVSEDKDPEMESNDKETWKIRKEKYLKQLENASLEATIVSLCDKIHNLKTILDEIATNNSIWDKFNSSKEDQLWFYEKFYKIISIKSDKILSNPLNIYVDILDKIKNT